MLHPRTQIVTEANIEISSAVMSAISKHKLTFGEVLFILADVSKDTAEGIIKMERNRKESA